MQALAGICLLLFVLTVTVVGVRMLLLARRTRGRHELLMGIGMVLIGAVGYPATLLSGFGGPVGDVIMPLWIGSTLVTQSGIACIYAFTWQTFRPRAAWGRTLVGVGIALMLVSLAGAAFALSSAPPDATSPVVVRSWILVGMLGYCGCFLWSGIEGFVHHRDARKRLAIGLADPMVVNRFLLWGIFGALATAINVASLIGASLGVDPSRSPMVLIPMGFFGFLASAAMYFAFVPPASYRHFVRSRIATQPS